MTLRQYCLVLGFVVLSLHTAACGYDVIWTGVEFENEGETLKLSTTEPLCGCLKISNKVGFPVHIRSLMEGRVLGTMELAVGQTTSINFDWAGARGTEVYHLETWNYDGQRVLAKDVLLLNDTGWPWHPCVGKIPGQPAPPICEIGPLKMSTGRNQM